MSDSKQSGFYKPEDIEDEIFLSYLNYFKRSMQKKDDMITAYQSAIPQYVCYDGTPFPGSLVTNKFEYIREEFEVRPDDIIIAGYPRSGNHWLKEVMTYILSGGDPMPAQEAHIYERMPILEVAVDIPESLSKYMDHYFANFGPLKPALASIATRIGLKSQKNVLPLVYTDSMSYIENLESPRVFHTHLPYHMIPNAAKDGVCKMIVVMRNGKDVSTSYYNMHKMYPTFGYYSGSWQEFLFSYLNGKVCFGSWFDHVQGFWHHRNKKHILFVHYEDMLENLQREVLRIADFIGKSLTLDQIEQVVEMSSFSSMRKNPMASFDKLHDSINTSHSKFLRKGKVGDWKSKYTVNDSEFFDVMYDLKWSSGGPQLRFEL